MNIVKNGTTLRVYGGSVRLMDRPRYALDCVMLYPMADSAWSGNRSLAIDPGAL